MNGSGSFTKHVTMMVDGANAIMANPAGLYVTVHTPDNPAGLVRGQLT